MIMEFDGKMPDAAALERLSSAMVHRGPDDQGSFIHKHIGLAFRRLSIIDVTNAGHQPMHSVPERYSIVFNGEIYNYIELRAVLEGRGYRFVSNSDTEVLLNAYIEWKEKCLEKLNGMWAFIIADAHTGECFCARDRFGVKPLYYQLSRERIVVASETSAIRASRLYKPALDLATISNYLFLDELDTTNDTFYAGIKALPPATYMTIAADGRTKQFSYWTLPSERSSQVDPATIRETFLDSVRLRLRSDVPVGVLLSGGLDSTSIICAAAREIGQGHDLRAYSYLSEEFDERPYVRATIEQTGATLIPLRVDDDHLWTQLLSMLRYHDAPVHTPSALIGYALSALARGDGVKVILNGQGSDETFAGYSSYFDNYWYTLLATADFRKLRSQLNSYGAHYGVPMVKLLKRVCLKYIRACFNKAYSYRRVAELRHRQMYKRNRFYNTDLVEDLVDRSEIGRRVDLDSALETAIKIQPLPLYLRIEDRNSMANSVEARLPFMDYRLVEAVMRLTGSVKIDGILMKSVLRNAMAGIIPDLVRNRTDKMGFPTPDASWVRQWGSKIEEVFTSASFRERGLFQTDNLLKALRLHIQGTADYHWDIFKALQLELWLRSALRES
jgi:asparagine synthase (glutamine-hydrolysing)